MPINIFDIKLDWFFFFFAAKKSPYLEPQSPYQKLQISLFEPKKISRMIMREMTQD